MAEELSSRPILRLRDASWRWQEITFCDSLEAEAEPSVTMIFSTTEKTPTSGMLFTRWSFDGQQARLRDVTASLHPETDFSKLRESQEQAHPEVQEILVGHPGALLRPQRESPRGWRSCAVALPDGTRLTYEQQNARLFLAEYRMRVTLPPPQGKARTFSLPMNTGGRTAILVWMGQTAQGVPAVRLVAKRHFAVWLLLSELSFLAPDEVLEAKLLGAIVEISTPLRWVATDEPQDRALLQEALDYLGPTEL